MNIPDWMKKYVVILDKFEYDSVTFPYALVSYMLGTSQGAPPIFTIILDDGTLAVSDAYPEEWRELGLIHEVMEWGTDSKDRHSCLKALKAELELAKEKGFDMRAYVQFRFEFFRNMVSFYSKKKPNKKETQILTRLKHSLRHLESLRKV
jgi:hypothetical protein